MDVVLNMSVLSKYHVEKSERQLELEIINAAKADPKNFAPLYKKYYDKIFHFVAQRLDSKEVSQFHSLTFLLLKSAIRFATK